MVLRSLCGSSYWARWRVFRLKEAKKHAEEIAALHLRTLEALALAIEAKDETTHDHLQRMPSMAVAVAEQLGLSEKEMEALRAAALLHDIGKLAVPEHILNKPGKLTPEEFERIKVHPIVGAEILERVQFPYAVVPIVRSHHEKWNGSGYPDGLKGEEIPIGARILAVVDCLDALTSDRQYRPALPLSEAMAVLQGRAARRYDPRVVEVVSRLHLNIESNGERTSAEPRRKEAFEISQSRSRGSPGCRFPEDQGRDFRRRSGQTSSMPSPPPAKKVRCSSS